MNLRCSECGTLSYSASPDVVGRKARCGKCGGALVTLEDGDPPEDDARDDRSLSGP